MSKKIKILLYFLISFLLLNSTALLDSNHILKNLEPYPDGILFALSAKNFALGKGLQLITQWGSVPFWVPPLYSWYLSIFYFFSDNINSFYIANILLGLGTICTLFLTLKKTTKNLFSITTGLSIYFSHLVIFWITSLAMTENLSLFLFSLLTLGLVEKNTTKKLFLVLSSILGLLLVRFSVFPILIASLVITTIQLKNKLKSHLKGLTTLFVVSILFITYLYKNNILNNLISNISVSLFNPEFFNLKFLLPNLQSYSKSLLFNQGQFLWLNSGISNWSIFGLFIYSIIKLKENKKYNKLYILLGLFISLFPLQLIFYTFDSRYLIYTIVLFSLAGAWLVNEIKSKKIIFIILTAVLLNVFFQKNLLKQLIADNWLGKSTAWQYEAILHFNENLPEDAKIITALPPFLVDAYQTKNYRPLPLSQSQEFLQKKQFVWGDDINYDNLITNYKDWLEQGRALYITNSYITHQQTVINDFEEFKKEFKLNLVSEGCLQACNIYKLELKK